MNNIYKAKLVKVIDGDSVVFEVDLGFKIKTEVTAQLSDLDAPEIVSSLQAKAKEAKRVLQDMLKSADIIEVIHTGEQTGAGRWWMFVAVTKDGVKTCVNTKMKELGYQK